MRTDNEYDCSSKKAYIKLKQLRQRVAELENVLSKVISDYNYGTLNEQIRISIYDVLTVRSTNY